MPRFVTGVVTEVLEEHPDLQTLLVEREEAPARRAILYTRYAAPAKSGDRVILNVTATALDLGSGGDDFVVWNLASDAHASDPGGHIMKLRYTPMQTEVPAVEAPESVHHEVMDAAADIAGMPVLAASLHSQLLPALAALRARRPQTRVTYVMTDGGALERSLSQTARRLREVGWLESVITVGHAVGGDLEAVNVYSGLLAARAIVDADVAVVGMGPGVVGTSTPFGTTALELGMTINAAASLGGRPIAVVRMSSADARDRHAGVSHHAVTALMRVALAAADVPVPRGHSKGLEEVAILHRVIEVDVGGVLATLDTARAEGLEPSHMGRGPEADSLFFLAAGAAGVHAADILNGGARDA